MQNQYFKIWSANLRAVSQKFAIYKTTGIYIALYLDIFTSVKSRYLNYKQF